eukprot:CAMPEP_0181120380 /NCGR_PEP_ID=MMETSP1071-20121207/24125_1 /TAXON_ID=35127 /ORGANISM="Thalassiosira sp., Strain NH16" /LENGTH=1158 /DNA_ID=CAMNT_0023205031 /DNA_START=138 /DNA_END=3614 /DNA_ORIENTATION=+
MSGGWDDDDDLLDAMLDDDDVVGDASGGAAVIAADSAAVDDGGNDAIGATGAVDIDDHGGNDHGAEVDDDEGTAGNDCGWDDDDDLDLDGLSSENEDPPNPPPPPQPLSCIDGGKNDNDDLLGATTMENTFAMLQEHEAIMEREIGATLDDVDDAPTQRIATREIFGGEDPGGEDAGSEDWDFEEDDDIFNEDNDDLGSRDVGDDNGGGDFSKGEEVATFLEREPKPPTPPLPTAVPPPPPPQVAVPPPPPAAALEWDEQQQLPKQPHNQDRQQLSENPFLSKEIDKNEHSEPPAVILNEKHDDISDNQNDAEDGDGWSDEDFFEDDDIISSSATSPPLPSVVPPPPPPPSLSPHVHQPPLATRRQPIPPPPAPMNHAQRRIHQMLSNYIATLNDPNFLTCLHQKLHLHQRHSSSKGDGDAATDLRTYYASRPGLRKYTLGVELDRMDYRLILPNGKAVDDKDVLRSYFGVREDGEKTNGGMEEKVLEGEAVTTEELLIRSANQSLLADMLVALMGSEEDVVNDNGFSSDAFFDQNREDARYQEKKTQRAGLILSGPTLCMTSVAESCQFKVDLQCNLVEAVCLLAISMPFHPNGNGVTMGEAKEVVVDGRLILARAQVSVRFRPGGEGGDINDEPTVQYAVQSVTPFHTPDSMLLQQAAISLAHDLDDPFFQNEFEVSGGADGETSDARDRFLLSHHLADSGMLVVSDHIDKLRDVAELSSTGFRSALRQLDGVTNVSAKLQFLKDSAAGQGGGGLGGFGLALPSAEEIEAAEREAAAGGGYRHDPSMRPPPHPHVEFRFPRPENALHQVRSDSLATRPPPPPPPPMAPKSDVESRPRPIIGGLFMSGLSRFAAAATQPDGRHDQSSWEGGGGTGLTPPSSPPTVNGTQLQVIDDKHPTLYRREENEDHPPTMGRNVATGPPQLSGDPREWDDEPRGFTGLTPLATQRPPQGQGAHFEGFTPEAAMVAVPSLSTVRKFEQKECAVLEEDRGDAGWSDDEFDFEDDLGDVGDGEETKETKVEAERTYIHAPVLADPRPAIFSETKEIDEEHVSVDNIQQRPITAPTELVHPSDTQGTTKAVPIPLPPLPPHISQDQSKPSLQHQRTFEEEFVIVLKEKIDAECQEVQKTGRMKRWSPIREDPILRKQLMEVMVAQIRS